MDLTGMKFGKWSVIEKVKNDKHRGSLWKCQCECGTIRNIVAENLKSGKTTQCFKCGHNKKREEVWNYKHGESKTRLYGIWRKMIERCENHKSINYKKYGAKGIYVCGEWHDYLKFREWSLKNGYTDELSIDRIENDKGYEPDNCRWATRTEQQRNRTITRKALYNGKMYSVAELSEMLNINYDKMIYHLDRGRNIDYIISM